MVTVRYDADNSRIVVGLPLLVVRVVILLALAPVWLLEYRPMLLLLRSLLLVLPPLQSLLLLRCHLLFMLLRFFATVL